MITAARMNSRTIILSGLSLCLAGTAFAEPAGGMLKTMPHGRYECALPGDATGPAWKPVTGASFTIGNASSYRTPQGSGTYILKGKDFTFTRGPFKGQRFRRTGDRELQQLRADGSLGPLICTRN